ncbi:MAG: cupin domain-containing protein [Hyphomicrobiales bacterium]|nr:cupin domain-containing protein [Hyphomicrobiales bacterium]
MYNKIVEDHVLKPVRRIVTGHNAAGRSVFIADGDAPNLLPALATPRMALTLIWRTTSSPAAWDDDEETAPAGLRVPTAPQQRGGTVFRIADFPPDSELGDLSQVDMARHGVQVSAAGRRRHVLFHTTDTVDYAIVLEGEIWAVLDDDEVLMKQGDVLVQRGTGHAWSNRSDRYCRVAFILVDAEPKRG